MGPARGVVDPDESPASCLVREIEEELGLTVEPTGLLAVNWMPPWLGWRDAVLLVFDLGVAASDITDRLVLEDREIRAVHWADESVWVERVAAYTARMLRSVTQGASSPSPIAYLEDGLRPEWEPPRT
ncbi:NUDIX domain-containing protein [Intrasporangium calvum]|uniref:NUDIX domain-containing protein n=1 Tax=Intrasporangium calvum TaxID=53358 RepID=UPI001F4286DC|nr:NUDIX hydrolase [Intrasporangium calvum]